MKIKKQVLRKCLVMLSIKLAFLFSGSSFSDEIQPKNSIIEQGSPLSLSLETGVSVSLFENLANDSTDQIELNFLDDSMAFTGTSKKLKANFNHHNNRYFGFYKKNESYASFNAMLDGTASSIVSSINVSSKSKMNEQEVGLGWGWDEKTSAKIESGFDVFLSKAQLKYKNTTFIEAGLITSNVSSIQNSTTVNLGYSQSIKYNTFKNLDVFANFERASSLSEKKWKSDHFIISTGISLKLQHSEQSEKKIANLAPKYSIKALFSDGIGTGEGKFNNKVEEYNGGSTYNSIIPIMSSSKSVRVLRNYGSHSIGLEFFTEKKQSNLSIKKLTSPLASGEDYDASISSNINMMGIAVTSERPLTSNSYSIVGISVSKLNYHSDETYQQKNNKTLKQRSGNSPFLSFKLGLGNKIQIRPNTFLFVETVAEGVNGDWFGQDHTIFGVSTAIGLGINF